eukprot:15629576-Heterocapsa_arctica.AAC.1
MFKQNTQEPSNDNPTTVHKPSTTFNTFKQTPEDRSTTFKHIQTPSKPCAPVCAPVGHTE